MRFFQKNILVIVTMAFFMSCKPRNFNHKNSTVKNTEHFQDNDDEDFDYELSKYFDGDVRKTDIETGKELSTRELLVKICEEKDKWTPDYQHAIASLTRYAYHAYRNQKQSYHRGPGDIEIESDVYQDCKSMANFYQKLETFNAYDITDYGWNYRDNVSKTLPLGNIKIFALLPALKTLILGRQKITDISILSKLSNLEVLQLEDNNITNGQALFSLTKLTHLNLKNNPIAKDAKGNTSKSGSDLLNSAVSQMFKLKYLNLENTGITDISGFSELKLLNRLSLKGNRGLKHILSLVGLKSLTQLDLQGTSADHNELTKLLAPVGGLDNIEQVYVHGCTFNSGVNFERVIGWKCPPTKINGVCVTTPSDKL